MARSDVDDGDWHLDKKVPLGLLIMIIIQTLTLVYVGTTWKSDIDNRIAILEKSDAASSADGTRLTILEQQYLFISTTLQKIDNKLDSAKTQLEKRNSQ